MIDSASWKLGCPPRSDTAASGKPSRSGTGQADEVGQPGHAGNRRAAMGDLGDEGTGGRATADPSGCDDVGVGQRPPGLGDVSAVEVGAGSVDEVGRPMFDGQQGPVGAADGGPVVAQGQVGVAEAQRGEEAGEQHDSGAERADRGVGEPW
jgi:hypothetical protein